MPYGPDDDEDIDEGRDTDEEEDDDAELHGETDAAFRAHRSRLRACGNVAELNEMRSEFARLSSSRELSKVARVRARDLVELVDDRVAELKAQYVTGRRS